MTFETEFPESKKWVRLGKALGLHESEQVYLRQEKDIANDCLSKQRVREALKKISFPIQHSGFDCVLVREVIKSINTQLRKELGL